jgi:hypothetical protein
LDLILGIKIYFKSMSENRFIICFDESTNIYIKIFANAIRDGAVIVCDGLKYVYLRVVRPPTSEAHI